MKAAIATMVIAAAAMKTMLRSPSNCEFVTFEEVDVGMEVESLGEMDGINVDVKLGLTVGIFEGIACKVTTLVWITEVVLLADSSGVAVRLARYA